MVKTQPVTPGKLKENLKISGLIRDVQKENNLKTHQNHLKTHKNLNIIKLVYKDGSDIASSYWNKSSHF